MKKCPYCKAEIEDNARFCLYCMTSFEQKQEISFPKKKSKRWPLFVIAAVFVLAVILIFALMKKDSFLDAVSSETGVTSDAGISSSITVSEKEDIEFEYRDAKYGDDYAVFADLTNCVVITGVKAAASDGVYTVPEKIDGKRVAAIMPAAFCGEDICDTVKTVILPSGIRTVWNAAFSSCYNLKDIYLCGDAVYIDPYAFAEETKRNVTMTIHCSPDCSDRDFGYYKESAEHYSAKYEEWNG